jgi:hypothetical protein
VGARLGCGALAGTTGQTVAYPFDVARRRLQMSGWQGAKALHADHGSVVVYRGMVDCFARTVREEGTQALFKVGWGGCWGGCCCCCCCCCCWHMLLLLACCWSRAAAVVSHADVHMYMADVHGSSVLCSSLRLHCMCPAADRLHCRHVLG